MKTSDYVLHCFGYSEKLLQLILRKEQQTKRPVQIITIFDMGEVNLSDYVNIMSPHLKLWKIRSDLWQDWSVSLIHTALHSQIQTQVFHPAIFQSLSSPVLLGCHALCRVRDLTYHLFSD